MAAFIIWLRENPVLRKEAFGKWRPRPTSGGSQYILLTIVSLVIVLSYAFTFRGLVQQNYVTEAASLFSTLRIGVELTTILLILPSLAAAAIAQERERQTWNALLLSRLSALEIVVGKYCGALTPVLLILLLFAPLDLLCAFAGRIPFLQYLLSSALLLATALFCAALGLFFSWARRRSYQATSSVFGVLAFLTVGVWMLFGLFQLTQTNRAIRLEEFPPLWVNPYFVMSDALRTDDRFPLVAVFALLFYPAVSFLLLGWVTVFLRRGAKELEQ